jgi:sporulation protein YlmC with PRC-barrel domain
MKQIGLSILTALAVLATGSPAPAQVAGTASVGVTVAEMKEVMLGWSAKKQFLGKPLYNDKGEKVGSIDDVIIGPDKTSVSYVIVGAGGFAGLGKHDVAIPVSQIKHEGGKFVLPGATKEAIKALPKFEYAKAAAAK